MADRYRLDPGRSRFTVQAFATGLLSFVGHSPTFAVREFSGTIGFEREEIEGMSLELTIKADSLELVDRVKPTDRREIEERMRRDVLETPAFPEIAFRADDVSHESVARGQFRLRIGGRLTLHGVTLPYQAPAELTIFGDGVRLRGEGRLRMPDYHIQPVTALGGAIRLKDDVHVAFDLGATPEASLT